MAANFDQKALPEEPISSFQLDQLKPGESNVTAISRSPTPGKSFSSTLFSSVIQRRRSLTLPSKRAKELSKRKKRVSMADVEKHCRKELLEMSLGKPVTVNLSGHERPLPPSPPPSPSAARSAALQSLSEECECKKSSQCGIVDFPGSIASSNEEHACFSSQSNGSRRMKLETALTKFNGYFPLRVKFIEGYCSEDSEYNLSANEIYDIHFVKKARVITFKDKDGFKHQLSLASATMLGLVYNPLGDYNQALAGYVFDKCSDIMAADPMPLIVCATYPIVRSDERHSVYQNEILIVKGIQKPKLRGKRLLRTLSIATDAEKLLPEECHGRFTTKPSLIRLHLSQIIESIGNQFPVQAVLYVDGHEPSLNRGVPQSGVITLWGCNIETSLIGRPVNEDSSGDNSEDEYITLLLNENMMELDIEVLACGKAQPDIEQVPDSPTEYDDIIVQKQLVHTASEEYDDVVLSSRREISDDEVYATVGKKASPKLNSPIETGYDKVPVEKSAHSTEALEV